jgi:alpha-amylase
LGNRFNHDPKDTSELTTHSDVENLIWCHQNLHFKDGAYFVRWQAQDALVIERGAKALIAVNDHYSSWQNLTNVPTNFPAGTVLKDYSGANGNATVVVNAAGQVNISIPPCDGSAAEGRRGYSVWAPEGISTNYVRPSESITQEWEMANDLGDSHASSLQQGGALPNNSTDCRVVGRVFPDSSSTLTVNIYPENPDASITLEVLNAQCEVIDTISAFGTLSYTHAVSYAGWHTLRIRNSSAVQPGQRCWVKANYTSPLSVNTAVAKQKCACTLTGVGMEELDEELFEVYPNPFNDQLELTIRDHSNVVHAVTVYQANGTQIHDRKVNGLSVLNLDTRSWAKGIYFIEVETAKGRARMKVMKY